MKVAFLLGSLNRGGAETLVRDVFRNWQNAGFSMIAIHRKDGDLKDDFYCAGPKMFAISPKPNIFQYLSRLRKIIKEENIDILHAQQYIDCIFGWFASRFLQVQLITTFHGFDTGCSKLRYCMNWLAIRMADKVCFVSNYERECYTKRYHLKLKEFDKKYFVVYNGVDFSRLAPLDENNKTLSDVDTIKMGMIGSFTEVRDQMFVCKLLKELQTKDIKFEFDFIGGVRPGEEVILHQCQEYCQENHLNVHFLGMQKDIAALLSKMDLYIYGTRHDTFGISVLEALASGVPVATNDWPVMREITQDGKWGRLWKSGNVDDAVKVVEALIADIQSGKVETKQIASQVREYFSIQNHIARLYEIYSKCTR